MLHHQIPSRLLLSKPHSTRSSVASTPFTHSLPPPLSSPPAPPPDPFTHPTPRTPPPPRSPDLYHSSGLKPQMDACEEVVSQLFPHQREALAWMVGRENSNALPPFWIASQTTGSGLLYTNRWGPLIWWWWGGVGSRRGCLSSVFGGMGHEKSYALLQMCLSSPLSLVG